MTCNGKQAKLLLEKFSLKETFAVIFLFMKNKRLNGKLGKLCVFASAEW
jgi:hypothetical protein